MKISQLPTAKMSPKTLLHQLFEDVENLESIVTLRLFQDGTVEVNTSGLRLSDLCFCKEMLARHISEEIDAASEDED